MAKGAQCNDSFIPIYTRISAGRTVWIGQPNQARSRSIEANIAEGCGRGGGKDFARFLQQAMGATTELECHLVICKDLEMLKPAEYESLAVKIVEIKRMPTSLMERVRDPVLN